MAGVEEAGDEKGGRMFRDGARLSPTAQPALGEMVTTVLREMISTGEFAPGSHLKEAELATALNVSRGPVREALTQLALEGHVELRRHKGAFVNTLTRSDVEEVHTLRVAIETLAAERACVRMGEADFAELDEVLAAMRSATADIAPDQAVRLDLAFHDLVYARAEHQRVQRIWTSIRSQVSFFLHTRNVNFPDFAEVGYAEHAELRDALAQADPPAARAAVEHHLSGAYVRLQQLDLPT